MDQPLNAGNTRPVSGPDLWTIGHATRALVDFIALLSEHGIEQLVDVRTIPRSRHNPQFNRDTFPQPLAAAGVAYLHMSGLGGLRRPRADSTNTGWRNASFRGYADHMATAEFEEDVLSLLRLAGRRATAIMCAEAVPWRCHRSLVADALMVRGVPVVEILSESSYRMHELTPFAQVEGVRITYPSEQATLL